MSTLLPPTHIPSDSTTLASLTTLTKVDSPAEPIDPVIAYQREIYLHTKKQMEMAANMARRRTKKKTDGVSAHASMLGAGSNSGSGSGGSSGGSSSGNNSDA